MIGRDAEIVRRRSILPLDTKGNIAVNINRKEKPMYCVSVAYPQKPGGTFNFEYYVQKHMPLVAGFVGANAVKAEVRRGVASPDGSAPHFVCLANFWIKSAQEFQATLAKHGKEIMGDIPNFTNIQPILQVDEVLA